MKSLENILKIPAIIVLVGSLMSCGSGGGNGGSGGKEEVLVDETETVKEINVKEGDLVNLGVYSPGEPLPDRKCFESSSAKEGKYSLMGPGREYTIATRKLDINSIYFCVPPLDFPKVCEKCLPGEYIVDLRLKGPYEDSIIKNAGVLTIK